MRKKLKKIPKFKSEAAERKFWQTHNSTDYLDWSKAKLTKFPNLQLSTKTISLRLPESMLTSLKIMANKKDIPYQSMVKLILAEKIKTER